MEIIQSMFSTKSLFSLQFNTKQIYTLTESLINYKLSSFSQKVKKNTSCFLKDRYQKQILVVEYKLLNFSLINITLILSNFWISV